MPLENAPPVADLLRNITNAPEVVRVTSAISVQAYAQPTISGANTDLAWLGGSAAITAAYISTAGGSLRSLGAPQQGAGTRMIFRNNISGTTTFLHQTAGGTGQQLYIRSLANLTLQPNESIEFIYDGNLWVEALRNVSVSSAGAELDYVQFTSNVTMTPALTEGASSQIVVTSSSITFDGAAVLMEFWCHQAIAGSGGMTTILYDNTAAASLGWLSNQGANNTTHALYLSRRFTPAAGARTYSIRSFFASGGAGTYVAGAGGAGTVLPGFMRFTKV